MQNNWLSLTWDGAAVHFSEIALKGGNRKRFIERLQHNIRQALPDIRPLKVSAYHDRLLISAPPESIAAVVERTSKVFGIAYVAPARVLPADFDTLREAALSTYQAVAQPGDTFAIRVKRADKQFPMKSAEIERLAGGYVKLQTGATVCLDNPDVRLAFRINRDSIYQEGPPIQGPNGLPVGSSGRVLTLFSGGIDSPVATWMALKRGCRSDFIHFHTFPSAEQVRDSKIVRLIQKVIRPQGLQARLYLVPYHTFEMGLLSATVPREYELVLFRRFMVRTACRVAAANKCSALITGDNLGQVASQTMGNLVAFDQAADRPVFRPLVMANKDEIVAIARRIDTFNEAVEPYKDCCSLVSSGPQTHPRQRTLRTIEESLPTRDMTDAALSEMSFFDIQ